MTRRFGEEKAREILELHERDGSAAGQPEERFDVVTGASESSPAIRAFLTEIEKPGDALEELLLKRPAVLTEPEMKSVLKSEAYWRAADPRHREIGRAQV